MKRLKALRNQADLPQDRKIEKTKKYLVSLPWSAFQSDAAPVKETPIWPTFLWGTSRSLHRSVLLSNYHKDMDWGSVAGAGLAGGEVGAPCYSQHFPDASLHSSLLRVQMIIGEHIDGYVAEKGPNAEKWELRLWQYVSRTTENSMDGAKLRSVYAKIKGAKIQKPSLQYPCAPRSSLHFLRPCQVFDAVS